MPKINTTDIDRERYYSDYVNTYLERDIKELSQVTADDVDFIDSSLKAGIDQTVNNADTVYPHEGLRRIQRDGHQTRSETCRDRKKVL